MATTMQQFCNTHGIKAHARQVGDNPNMSQGDFPGGTHWRVRLTARIEGQRRQVTVPFSMGSFHTEPPTADTVLDCLASDAASIENARDFGDWCADLGYDPDSRKAERIYKACERQSDRLKRFLGGEYETLLWKTEAI